MGMGWYDRQGNKIRIEELGALYDGEDGRETYRRVAADQIGPLWVSTLWLGLDHSFGDNDPPLIFETMVFNRGDEGGDVLCERWATEAEAFAGHQDVVNRIREGTFTDYSGEVVDTSYQIQEVPG